MSDRSGATQLDAASPPARPQRADARRNRERVVAAAREVFSEQGRDAQIDDVARRAGLGIGTVYRHFPTKEALLEALAVDKFERLHTMATEALETEEPGEAFVSMIWRAAEQMQRDRSLSEAVSGDAFAVASTQRARLHELVCLMLRRAQAAGTLREDLDPDDIPVLMCSVASAVRHGASEPERWRRYVGVLCDGLRPPRC